jgi:RNA polymerase sigma factor (sigma-70 family)
MQPELDRIGDIAIQPRLRAKLDKFDVCQSVLGDLLLRLPEIQFRTRSEFCAYLLNKMRWKATDRGRQRIAAEERERLVAEGERGEVRAEVPQPVEALIEVEDRRRVQEVLAQMTPREQEVLRLHLDGKTPKEIAEHLRLTRDAVYKALQRGMARARLMG